MKRNIIRMLLAVLTSVAATSAWALEPNAQGVYELSSADDLTAFAALVNGGQTNVNACLMQDITMPETSDWTPIALDNNYGGTIDGQGHTLTLNIIATSGRNGALIGNLSGSFKNMTIAGSIQTNFQYAASVVRDNRGGVIENVLSTVAFTLGFSGDNTAGGIVAVNQSGTIRQCIFAGSMTGAAAISCGGIVGWRSAGNISGCANIAEWNINMTGGSNAIARNGGSNVTNCATLENFGGAFEDGTAKVSKGGIASGELCYLLNGGQSENPMWYQTLGQDALPVTDSTHGVVYANGRLHCDATSYTETEYSNTNKGLTQDEHQFESGICSYCGAIDENFMSPDGEGWFNVGDAGQMAYIVARINKGQTNIKVRLTADIDFTKYNVYMSRFDGTLDGQSHTLTLQRTATSGSDGALIGDLYGTVRNIAIAGSIETNYNFAP
ncbi:MAG: hypothetical protein IJT48_02970, partial [Bacteroidaceae bacterium]|nr:hypothetical protein [Bacteroidaceae bacterium]